MRFDELDLESSILDGLDSMNFVETTPVQEQTIPVILTGKDIIACAQTGTGKTASFVLPLLNQLTKSDDNSNKIRAIIMAPTRELAQQIDIQIQGFSYFCSISSLLVCGGGDGKEWEQQKRGMKMGADIVIATPGRLISHLEHSKIDFSHVTHFILDEADRMLDMGFYDDIMKLVKQIPESRQTILFSATMPPKIRNLIKSALRNPVEVSVAISKPSESIDQSVCICYDDQKLAILKHIFSEDGLGKSIIFCSSKLKVKDLAYQLRRNKMRVAAMHSDLEQDERQKVMLDFSNGKLDLLVATDIIARGIDIDDIALVINYDVPRDAEDYIHRIGRTGRADAKGRAITLVNIDDQFKLSRIEKLIEREVPRYQLPEGIGDAPEYEPSKKRSNTNRRAGANKASDSKGREKSNHTPNKDKTRPTLTLNKRTSVEVKSSNND
ncbi:MAG: DEAD/DEAH box helicase [Bacteroidales bacterium]